MRPTSRPGRTACSTNSGYKIAAEFDTPDWSPDKAQAWMESQIGAVKANLTGVYAANDGTGGGAIAALKGGGVNPLPPVTGQDAELAAIQRILAGDQALTIYKAIKPQAEDAAKNAIALANGQKPTAAADKEGVPATLLDPVVVYQGQRQGHRRRGQLLQGERHLHPRVRQGMRRGRPQLTTATRHTQPHPHKGVSRA